MRTLSLLPRRAIIGTTLAFGWTGRRAAAQVPSSDNRWPALAAQIFDDRSIGDGQAILSLDAPYRAEDAAVVPVSIRSLVPASATRRIQSMTLVIDQNPSPLAAKFVLGENSGIETVSTRIRVDSYTQIHAVAEMTDNQLFAVERFVKAAGGCSAPASKQDADSIRLGTMRFRQFAQTRGSDRHEAQLMIRHPNNSGLQMDQITRLYVPAHFVSSIHIWQGNDLLVGVESGISIAENPEYRFDYRPNGATEFHAEVEDSEGRIFKETWSVARA